MKSWGATELSAIVGAGALLVVAAELWYTMQWNRRHTAFELLVQFVDFMNERREALKGKVNQCDPNQTYDDVQLDQYERVQLQDVLNYLDLVALALVHDVIDERIARIYIGSPLLDYARWARPYIEQVRRDFDPEAWESLLVLAEKWKRPSIVVGPKS